MSSTPDVLTLDEELFLLLERPRRWWRRTTVPGGCQIGGMMVEMAAAGLLVVGERRRLAATGLSAGHRMHAHVLTTLASSSKLRKAHHWVVVMEQLAYSADRMDLLADRGLIDVGPGPSVQGRTPYRVTDEASARSDEVAERVRAALTGTGPVAPATARLAAMLGVAGVVEVRGLWRGNVASLRASRLGKTEALADLPEPARPVFRAVLDGVGTADSNQRG